MFIDRRWLICLVALLAFLSGAAMAQPDADYRAVQGTQGSEITFVSGDLSYSAANQPPASGWHRARLPSSTLLKDAERANVAPPTVWIRLRFERSQFGNRPIALFSDSVREHFTLYMNGGELYRSRASDDDQSLGWNQPLLLPLPSNSLRSGKNEILVRVTTSAPRPLQLGAVYIGPDATVRSRYNRQHFLRNTGPQIICGYLCILTIGSIAFWIRRPREQVFGWLAAVGLIWVFRNLHYFVQTLPFDAELFWMLTTDSVFLLMAAVFGFSVTYFDVPKRRRLITTIALVCAVGVVARHVLVALHHDELPSFLLTIPVAMAILTVLASAFRQAPRIENGLMLIAVLSSTLFSFHDVGFSIDAWRGAGIPLQPFGGFLVFAAFDIALTSKLQRALITVEGDKQALESLVAEVTETLGRSEAARAALQVAHAVDGERERLMREIHDGIGSSLITALAGAKRRNESPETIATLSRSITDLRIGVDSLEPVNGDVVLLLANLRHRMERELKGSGLAFVWKVESSPPLTWLDPIGALHVLRILQQAVGNILAHAEARFVEVICHASRHEHADGVLIEIADDGCGFSLHDPSTGKGLSNMAGRAEALNARFRITSAVGVGTRLSIWLPLEFGHDSVAGQTIHAFDTHN